MDKGKKKEKIMSVFDKLMQYCPTGIVKRQDLFKLTGGLISPGTMAHLDIEGRGIAKRTTIGRKIAYDIKDVIKWLEDNTKLVNFYD